MRDGYVTAYTFTWYIITVIQILFDSANRWSGCRQTDTRLGSIRGAGRTHINAMKRWWKIRRTSFYAIIIIKSNWRPCMVSLYAAYSSVKIEDLLGHSGILPPADTEGPDTLTVYGGIPAWRNLESQQTVTILASEDLGGHKAITASGYLADVGTILHLRLLVYLWVLLWNGEPLDVVVYGLVSERFVFYSRTTRICRCIRVRC